MISFTVAVVDSESSESSDPPPAVDPDVPPVSESPVQAERAKTTAKQAAQPWLRRAGAPRCRGFVVCIECAPWESVRCPQGARLAVIRLHVVFVVTVCVAAVARLEGGRNREPR